MKKILKFLLPIILIGIIGLGVLGMRFFSAPTTTNMEDFFTNHKLAFEEKNRELLTALSQQITVSSEGDTMIGYRWVEVEPKQEIYQKGDPVIVRYYTHLKGIGVGAFGTGIAYLDPRREEKSYPDFEAMMEDRKGAEGFIGYSRISGNWYSFFWEAD